MPNKFLSHDDQRAPKVRQLFTALAPRYDLANDIQSFGLHRWWKRRTAELATEGARPGWRVLDLCCGTGDLTFEAQRHGAELVVGVDFAEAMLDIARQRRTATIRSRRPAYHVLGGEETDAAAPKAESPFHKPQCDEGETTLAENSVARVTEFSSTRFMAPMRCRKAVEATHEPQCDERETTLAKNSVTRVTEFLAMWFMVRMRRRKTVEATHEPPSDERCEADIPVCLVPAPRRQTGMSASQVHGPDAPTGNPPPHVGGYHPSRPASTVQFVQADALRLPFADASFDAVTIGYGLRNVADIGASLGEMLRVLRPGGRVVVLDCGKPDNALVCALFLGYLRVMMPLIGWLFHRDPDTYRYITASLEAFPAQRGIEAMMRRAGMTAVRVHNLLLGTMGINYGERANE